MGVGNERFLNLEWPEVERAVIPTIHRIGHNLCTTQVSEDPTS